jgi:putative ABC transport system permease protein
MKNKNHRPPRLAEWLLKFFSNREDGLFMFGDFDEEFSELVETKGIRYARRWYWRHVLRSIPVFVKDSIVWSITMIRSYLKIASRNILKHRGFSIINIFGLAAGLACSTVIILYVFNELSYDSFHQDAHCIYRVSVHRKSIGGEFKFSSSPGPLAPVLKETYPQIEEAVRVIPPYENASHVLVTCGEKRFFESRIYFADPAISRVFRIPFVYGNPATSLKHPNTIVLTEDMARKYFAEKNPIGKLLAIEFDHDVRPVKIEDFEVTGVIKNSPVNTHLKYDMFVSMATLSSHRPRLNEDWMNPKRKYTYIKLKPGTNINDFERQIQRLSKSYKDAYTKRTGRTLVLYRFFLQPITGIHMYSHNLREPEAPGNWYYIYIYSIVALLILLIGCMNFINLSAVLSSTRTKEVGLRKVVGAKRGDLVWQFLGESFLITVIAFLFALLFITLLLPLFNRMAGTELSLAGLKQPAVLVSLLGLLLVVSIGAACYPAFFITIFKPVAILRGKLAPGVKGSLMQKTLVIGQFAISIFLVICTISVFQQLDFMKGRALGFNRHQKLILPIKSNLNHFRRNYEAIKNDLKNHVTITGAAASSRVAGEKNLSGYYLWPKNMENNKPIRLKVITIDFDFLSEYDIQMAAGRPFLREMGNDPAGAFLINEAGVKHLGFKSAEAALGKQFKAHYHGKTKKIVGVTKNFHFSGMQEVVEPLIMDIEGSLMRALTLSVTTENIGGTIKFVRKKWGEHFPGVPFEYSFLDEDFDRVYRYEEQMGRLLGIITLLGISVASLGLLGLAAFIARMRKKEISIRKVLGASTANILVMMSRQFVTLVLTSGLIAVPVAYFAVNKWLQDFAYRINLGWFTFLIAAVSALVIAIITVSLQGARAAAANPADTLGCE